jgi:hypothetical protein
MFITEVCEIPCCSIGNDDFFLSVITVVTNYYLAMLLLCYFVILKAVNFIETVK